MTISLRLDRGQRRRMTRLLRKTRSRIEALRARVLLLLDEGVIPGVVAEMVGCARATVYRTLYRFEDLGEDSLVDQRQHRPPSKMTAEVAERLVSYIDGSPQDFGWQRTTWTLELLAVHIIHKSRQTLRHLARLGGRIVLHFLPPYSPESNVIERLWKQLHDHVTRNHTHRTIEPLMEAVDEFIVGAQPFPGTQVSLLAHAA
jgi:transposase